MSKKIKIDYKTYRIPAKIVVDGIDYPINQRNLDVVAEYEKTKDEAVLDKLINFSIVF